MRKKRFYQTTAGIIILVIIGSIIALWVLKAPIVASYMSHKLGVNVSIGRIGANTSKTGIHNFKINNPIGARTNTAFSSHDIYINYKWSDLRSDPSVIDDIQIEDAFLNIELYNTTGTRNNWTQILSNVDDQQDKDSKEVIIKKLVITNLSVQVRGKGFLVPFKKIKEIPRIEFHNISSKEGFPTEKLIKEIFDEADLSTYIKEVIETPAKIIDKFLSPFFKSKKN